MTNALADARVGTFSQVQERVGDAALLTKVC